MSNNQTHKEKLERAVSIYVDSMDLETLVYWVTESIWADLLNEPIESQLDFIEENWKP